MGEINKITGRDYHLFNYYGCPDAEEVIIAMGSVDGVIRETVDYFKCTWQKDRIFTGTSVPSILH